MKVLILGATGFIGLPVAQAFVRNGHEVYGSTRSSSKSSLLASSEIIPLVGTAWHALAPLFELIIDCASGGPDQAKGDLAIAEEASRKRGPYKASYIYTSGTWVHGGPAQRDGGIPDERAPLGESAQIVAWRPSVEQQILTSQDVNAIVIRPALLYGKTMSLFEPLFEAALKGGTLEWMGASGSRYSTIHGDDLADLYVRVGEAAPICKGLTFDACNSISESVDAILAALVKASGSAGYKYRSPANLFETAMTTEVLTRPSLGRALVGWVPKKMGFVDGMAIYWRAWVEGGKAEGKA